MVLLKHVYRKYKEVLQIDTDTSADGKSNKLKNYHIRDYFFNNSDNAHYTQSSWFYLAVSLCVCKCVYDVPVLRAGCENPGSDRAIG